MSIFRTIAMFLYLFGYMIVHYGTLRRGERALAAGDTETVEQLVDRHIPRWSRGILKVTGVTLTVEGLEIADSCWQGYTCSSSWTCSWTAWR